MEDNLVTKLYKAPSFNKNLEHIDWYFFKKHHQEIKTQSNAKRTLVKFKFALQKE